MKTKDQKREEAAARQGEYDALSLRKKLEQIKLRRGESKREQARLIDKSTP